MLRSRPLRLVLAVALLATGGVILRGYITDDTYIHLRYARHLLERGELAFNAGDPTYGCTSPLWVLCLALLLKLGVAPLAAPVCLGAASALLALLLLDAFLVRLAFRPAWRLPLLLLCAGDAWFVRWTWSGMETPLATALLLLLAWPAIARGAGRSEGEAAPLPPARWLVWGMACGLAALTRPEFLLLALLAWPWLAWRGQRPLVWRAALPAALGGLLTYGVWLLYAWRAFGRLTPATAAAKSYATTLAPAIVGPSLARSAAQLGATQAPLWLALATLAVLAAATRGRGTGGGGRPGDPPDAWPRARLVVVGLALTWTAALVGGYAVKQVWVISRYVSPLSPLLLLAMAIVAAGLPALPARWRRWRAAVLLGACLATLGANGWLLIHRVRPHAVGLARGLRECLVPLGQRIARETPPGAVVACLDVGALGWASERRILDLAGLVSPELLGAGRAQGFAAMVASGAWLDVAVPDYLVDRTDGPPRWTGRVVRGIGFTPLASCVMPGLGVTEPQAWTVTLYRLEPASGP